MKLLSYPTVGFGTSRTYSSLTPKGPRVFQWKNGQNYPLLKNTLVISKTHKSMA
jgi:hypothetical protein